MQRNEARKFIVTHPEKYLQLDNKSQKTGKITGYICPICGSGTGTKGTGITTKDGVHFTCWTGCFTNSDIIDIIGIEKQLSEYNDKFRCACNAYDINYDDLKPDYSIDVTTQKEFIDAEEQDEEIEEEQQENKLPNYMPFYEKCKNYRKGNCDYLNKRGISDKTQDHFFIGYCPTWRSPKALSNGQNPGASKRVIIPSSRYHYLARDINPNSYNPKMKEGKLALFNLKALDNPKTPVFVVEGEIDAMSIYEVGYQAIALGGAGGHKILLNYLKKHALNVPILVALDSDNPGQKMAEKLLNELLSINVEAYRVNINGEYKDPNEHLIKNRQSFIADIEKAMNDNKAYMEQEREAYKKTSVNNYIEGFINGISDSVNTPYIPTGFKSLDEILDGGLYEGLYIIGAISSLGKTTLALQIADQIARQGKDVLIFSLEMARTELMAKSISRITAEKRAEEGLPKEYAKTTRGITVGNFYKKYLDEERKLIQDSIDFYSTYANHIYINEGMGDIGVKEIKEIVQKHILFTGNTPIVIIDYIQILAPYSERATDKQNTDKAVLELKRMSRDHKTPVIGISSFNRANYNSKASMQAFKESGAIEYGSDVLLALQLKGVEDEGYNVDVEKGKETRSIELKVLKNRNGRTGSTIGFEYLTKYNYFMESETPDIVIGFDAPIKDVCKRKPTKREKERQDLIDAFNATEFDGKTTIKDMAEYLDVKRSQTIINRIKEYGGYVVDAKTGDVTKEKETEPEQETLITN